MNIGRLRERVTIQAGTTSDDSMGGGPVTWAAIATTPIIWARIKPMRGNERVQAMQLEADVSHEVTIRYRTDILPAYRLLWGSVALNIRAIMHDEKRASTTLMVEQGPAN